MGEFLSVPIKDKVTELGENTLVYFVNISLDMLHVECKDGVREWRTHM